MDAREFFLARDEPLRRRFIDVVRESVDEAQMRRPLAPRVKPVAENLWHLYQHVEWRAPCRN